MFHYKHLQDYPEEQYTGTTATFKVACLKFRRAT